MRFNTNSTKWAWGVVAAAAFVAAPVGGLPTAAALGQSYEEIVQQVNNTEQELRDEEARFAKETAGMNKGGRTYRAAAEQHERRVKEVRDRRASLKNQAERAKTKVAGRSAEGKLDNVGDAIANEKKRHAEAMKRIPAGSMAAQDAEQRHQDKLADLRTRREDVKEDRAAAGAVRQSSEQYKQDTKALQRAIDAENARHAKAKKYLPANSPQAQEEERYHQQKLAEAHKQFGAAADRREVAVTGVVADKQVDGELDNVNRQLAAEKTRHDRRMAQVWNGSAAAVEEDRMHAETMSRLGQRKAELEDRAAGARGAAEQKYALKRKPDDLDRQLAEENARFQRRLNDIEAGSEVERLERQRHDRVVADLGGRKSQVVARLNGVGGAEASGR